MAVEIFTRDFSESKADFITDMLMTLTHNYDTGTVFL